MFPNREGVPPRVKRRVCAPDPFQQVGAAPFQRVSSSNQKPLKRWQTVEESNLVLQLPSRCAAAPLGGLHRRRPCLLPLSTRAGITYALPLPPQIGLVPFVDTVHNRLTVEIRRGCTRGCRWVLHTACAVLHGACSNVQGPLAAVLNLWRRSSTRRWWRCATAAAFYAGSLLVALACSQPTAPRLHAPSLGCCAASASLAC